MDAATSRLVRRRAGNRCEYCHLPQEFSVLQFHIEHIVSRQHRGSDHPKNLALACPECNRHKGPNLSSLDPDSGRLSRLFNPRQDRWNEHFYWQGTRLLGSSAVGRTTVWVLNANTPRLLRLRKLILASGWSLD
jgi:hypothetical protein